MLHVYRTSDKSWAPRLAVARPGCWPGLEWPIVDHTGDTGTQTRSTHPAVHITPVAPQTFPSSGFSAAVLIWKAARAGEAEGSVLTALQEDKSYWPFKDQTQALNLLDFSWNLSCEELRVVGLGVKALAVWREHVQTERAAQSKCQPVTSAQPGPTPAQPMHNAWPASPPPLPLLVLALASPSRTT